MGLDKYDLCLAGVQNHKSGLIVLTRSDFYLNRVSIGGIFSERVNFFSGILIVYLIINYKSLRALLRSKRFIFVKQVLLEATLKTYLEEKMGRSRIPKQLVHLVSNSVKNYLEAKESLQRLVNMTNSIRGRCGDYVFQMSNGSQQIKLYEPEKYKNYIDTPLRKRGRTIIRLASEDPSPDKVAIIRLLYRTYPYYLKKDVPINLRLRNFYFDREVTGSTITIYKKRPNEDPDPNYDELYETLQYEPKKAVKFKYRDDEEEWFYAVNDRTGEMSNVLHFLWHDQESEEA